MEHSPDNCFHELQRSMIAGARPSPKSDLGQRNAECLEHGPYLSNGIRYLSIREIWSGCPACEERRLANEAQAEMQRKADLQRQHIEAQIQQAAVPPRFVGRSLENFNASTEPQQNALEIARDYAENFDAHYKRGDGLILAGLPGTGKSHLATAILQAIMPKHCGMYITCMSLIRMVRGTWRKDSETSESEVLTTIANVPLLVMDEIGVQYGTDGEQTILFDVLDRRYREMKPTILLTNQAKQGFKDFIGERSFDRLVESSRWVSFDWPSYRATARREAA